MTVGNTLFTTRESQLVTYESESSKTQAGGLVRKNKRKFLKEIKVLPKPNEESIIQHKLLVCDFKIRKVNENRRKFVPRERYRNCTNTAIAKMGSS